MSNNMTGRKLLALLASYVPYQVGLAVTSRGISYSATLEAVDFGDRGSPLKVDRGKVLSEYPNLLDVKPILYALEDVAHLPIVLADGTPSPLHTLVERLGILVLEGEEIETFRIVDVPANHRPNALHFVCSTTRKGQPCLDHEVDISANGHVVHRSQGRPRTRPTSSVEPHWRYPDGAQVLAAFGYLVSQHVAVGAIAAAPAWYVRKQVPQQKGGPANG
jgi:hypothetical protein